MINKLIINPIQRFINIESFSGILLFAATIIALIWANSPWGHTYETIWGYQLGVKFTNYQLVKPLILWINDGLMAIFFFLIGLEIKRELLAGELNSFKKAILPLFAAIGGVAVPALIFVLLNQAPETLNGWAIPMATDIAFSLAILKLLGDRVSDNLKVFLVAFAIVDDLVAVTVIALFYSGGIKFSLVGYAFLLLGILFLITWFGKYSKYLLLITGIIIWLLFLKAGIHPTIAGVLLAFTVPMRQKIKLADYTESLESLSQKLKSSANPEEIVLSNEQIEHIDNIDEWTTKVQSPLQYLEHKLHDWVAYVIMPIFALSNAGVTISAGTELNMNLIFAIAAALFFGKSLGVFAMSNLAVISGTANFPTGVKRTGIAGASFLAGVGFTMAIFIATLAFSENLVLLDSAKVGILVGSFLSGIVGYLILRFTSD